MHKRNANLQYEASKHDCIIRLWMSHQQLRHSCRACRALARETQAPSLPCKAHHILVLHLTHMCMACSITGACQEINILICIDHDIAVRILYHYIRWSNPALMFPRQFRWVYLQSRNIYLNLSYNANHFSMYYSRLYSLYTIGLIKYTQSRRFTFYIYK